MADFEKTAQLLEQGLSPQSSITDTPLSSNLTSCTGQSEQSENNRNASAPTANDTSPVSGVWRRISHLLSCHLPNWETCKPVVETANGANPSGGNEAHHGSTKSARREYIVRSLKTFPTGYPNLATFADSDESYMIYRRFGYLQSRVLLERQDELRLLEEKLEALDKSEMYSEPDNLFSREDQGEFRKNLLNSIETQFCQYAQLLVAAQQLVSFNRPSSSEHRSVTNYVRNENPVLEKEAEYVHHREDLITLRPGRENAWLDRSIEKLLKVFHCSMLEYCFCSKESKKKASKPTQVYYSKDRIEGCSTAVVTIMILFLLIVPIYLLFHLVEYSGGLLNQRSDAICIGILLVFTLIFSAVMSLFTAAKKHEILGAAAAYCAVLVVFMGNSSGIPQG